MAGLRLQGSQKNRCFTHLQWYCGAEFKDETKSAVPTMLLQKIIYKTIRKCIFKTIRKLYKNVRKLYKIIQKYKS